MSIQVGQPVPDIELDAYVRGEPDPRRLTLAAPNGGWVVLFFYPRDFTFVCPTELQAFAELHDGFDAEHATLIAASTDSYWSHKAWFESLPELAGVRYPVIADTAHALSGAFGVRSPDGSALRGTFLIDPERVIRHASVTDMNVGRSPGETLRTLQALRTGELCPVDWTPGQPTLTA